MLFTFREQNLFSFRYFWNSNPNLDYGRSEGFGPKHDEPSSPAHIIPPLLVIGKDRIQPATFKFQSQLLKSTSRYASFAQSNGLYHFNRGEGKWWYEEENVGPLSWRYGPTQTHIGSRQWQCPRMLLGRILEQNVVIVFMVTQQVIIPWVNKEQNIKPESNQCWDSKPEVIIAQKLNWDSQCSWVGFRPAERLSRTSPFSCHSKMQPRSRTWSWKLGPQLPICKIFWYPSYLYVTCHDDLGL